MTRNKELIVPRGMEASKMSWMALPVEPACIGKTCGGKRGVRPCSLDWLDRNLDIDNIMDLYKVLSFHKPQTQIIAVIHNPALIYKLSKLDCVNFIEMTKGYLKKITGFMNKK